MTIDQLTKRLMALKPHTFTAGEVMEWIANAEGMFYADCVQTHDNPDSLAYEGYTAETPDSTELLAPSPYDEFYLYYLMAQVDLHNLEYDKYNNSAALFNAAKRDLLAFWNRTYMPVQRVTHWKM